MDYHENNESDLLRFITFSYPDRRLLPKKASHSLAKFFSARIIDA